MAKVTVLINGYVKGAGSKVVPTTTLIQDGNKNILVDPGMGAHKKTVLQNALKKFELNFGDINIIFCTHYHLDHTQFVGLFSKAALIDYKYSYKNNNWLEHKGDGYHLSPNVCIIHTSGHTIEHASLLVKTEKGNVVVAGDLWWHSNFQPRRDSMAWNQEILEKSRKKILKVADYVIPGHGKMVKVKSY